MIISSDRRTNMIINSIQREQGKEQLEFIESFCDSILNRNYKEFQDEQEIFAIFYDFMKELFKKVKYFDREIIKEYTGTLFRNINAILRNTWDYEINGKYTKEIEKYSYEIAYDVERIINDSGSFLPADIKVYRGVPITAFRNFGVSSLEDLVSLKGQYVFDSGFTSTSIIRNRSFFDKPLEYHDTCNVEIEYLVPLESSDVLPIITDSFTYSRVQTELLINKGSLSKIIDVNIVGDKAYIKAIHIPQRIWDKKLDTQLNRRKK